MTPSSLFYHDTLEPAAVNGTVGWSKLPNADLPFVFWNVVSDEEMVDEVRLFFSLSFDPRCPVLNCLACG